MNKQQFQSELAYGAAVFIATSMLRRRLITPTEFNKLKAALTKKYRPVIGSLQETALAVSSPKQVTDSQKTVVKRLPEESNTVKNERRL